ncbi:hypothetical protein SAMN04487935_2368 [Flavobacterium noncentrifugens]|uniref:DUF2971 domain-containing protein n=2 Tax=Flavobacterium noncentrifugens TaxID=1128970 RepID=A0A1G8YL68_9FLAO|nr:hypothetical protein SAMN04487935_2368 [Flavobacterium noncentrifugens]
MAKCYIRTLPKPIMDTDIKKLNRFTTFPFVVDLLKRKKLTLLNPTFWEDYNDRETMEIYRQKTKSESIYALCFTHRNETIHHWNAFANGTSGCCIEFSPEKLFDILSRDSRISHGKTQYMSLKGLCDVETAQLPYLKRLPFEPEKEYRIIAASNEKQNATLEIDIDLNAIRRITISNKIPQTVFESMKKVLLEINPEFRGKIYHSTLFNNQTWIGHFKK